MNCSDEWGVFNELPYDMPVIFFQYQAEKVFICLLFGYSYLKIMEGHGGRDNTCHCDPPEAGCAYTEPRRRGGWGEALLRSPRPCLVLVYLHGDERRHLMNPLDDIWVPAVWYPEFTHSIGVAQWSVATLETLGAQVRDSGWKTWKTSREKKGDCWSQSCGKNRRAPRAPSGPSKRAKEPSQPNVWSWEGNLPPSCPARTAQELGWARAPCGHGLSRATVSILSDLTLGRLQPRPLFSAHVDISGLSFPVSIPLPTLSSSGFCGTGPSPNSWSGLWHRPMGAHGAQF